MVKVVTTNCAAAAPDWLSRTRREHTFRNVANRFRDAAESHRFVLVRDIWLTNFDTPRLHTMFIDKQLREHGLMQVLARIPKGSRTYNSTVVRATSGGLRS